MKLAVLLAALPAAVNALPAISNWHKYALEHAAEEEATKGKEVDPSEVRFTQRLDHFDRQVTKTWQQRSFQNDTFFNGSGPVFICVGGEGPALDASVLKASVHCNDMVELAPQVGALMVALEHRYYGDSMPVGESSFSTQNLRWLSSQQALGDLAVFHQQIVANYSLTGANKWVSFGGSYPGMMAGFFRLKYPNLVHASVSSSSPWLAKVDMQEYQDIVGDSLALTSVGGSDTCKSTVVEGHGTIASMIKTAEGRQSVAETFNFCDPDTALPSEATAGSWASDGVIYVPSQENDPSCSSPACDIGSICGLMNETAGDDLAKLAAVSSAQNDGNCLQGWTAKALRETTERLLDTTNSARSWPYQTCTEFAFYQTCEFGSRCPFVQGYNNLSQMISMCETLFGISPEQVAEQVAFSNAFYGGDAPAASRILYPNGDVDPWHGLGVLTSPSPDQPVMMVSGASHHAWTHPADTITQDSVKAAKEEIQAQVLAWLQED